MGGGDSRRYDWEAKVAAARDHVENGLTKTEAMASKEIVAWDVSRSPDLGQQKRLPAMLRMYLKYGIDMREVPILIYPTLHYQNGGLDIDANCMTTNVENLFVAGEAVGGIHGKNRLMGNSLLDIIVFGRSADKRHYTLNINKVNALMDQLRERYDYIIIDTPPNDLVSDAMALCRCANCVLYVVRQDYVKRNQIINSIVSMHAKGITISGCIFNGVPRYQRHYGYGYRYGYGYGYDYGSKKYHYGYKYSYGKKYRYGYSYESAYSPKKTKREKRKKST